MRVIIDRLVVSLAIACVVLVASFTIARSQDNQSAGGEGNDDHNATAITDCGTNITQPGRYFLVNDLKQCPDVGISITVSSVKVELRGHTIQGPLITNVSTILANGGTTGLSDLEIEGPGTVIGGDAGINFGNVHHSRVRNLVVVQNNFGMEVNAGDLTNDATVAATASTENEFRDNVVTGNFFDGINVSENRFIHNNLSGNSHDGLFLFNANNNVARDNTTDVNLASGIEVGTLGSGNRIDHNTALGNTGPDLFDEQGDCTHNTWTNNSFNSNSPACIQSSSGNPVQPV